MHCDEKFLNKPEDFVNEMVEGILAAHPVRLKGVEDEPGAIVRADAPVKGKAAIATGGLYRIQGFAEIFT